MTSFRIARRVHEEHRVPALLLATTGWLCLQLQKANRPPPANTMLEKNTDPTQYHDRQQLERNKYLFFKPHVTFVNAKRACFFRVHPWLKLSSNSSGVTVAVPILPTTIPAA